MSQERAPTPRALELLNHEVRSIHERTDRLFSWLLLTQWLAGIACALWVSPLTWAGAHSSTHPHVLAAIFLGGLITVLPVALVRLAAGRPLTRHVVAAAQVLWSAMLIDLTGGRIETHFHVFGSLAFLAFYRDWRVLITATVIVAVDHLVRGLWWPQSVFGLVNAGNWRWAEHAGWVLFEDAFLIPSCLRGLAEMKTISDRQAQLEESKAAIEDEVRARTSELVTANESLARNRDALTTANEELTKASAEREALHDRLVQASREAGMAEVATGVLHNVGNVLNTVNVSARIVADRVRTSEVADLTRAAQLLREHQDVLPDYLSKDERGRHMPRFLIQVAECLAREQEEVTSELKTLLQGIEHVKSVVSLQQEHATARGLSEPVSPHDIMETMLVIHGESLKRHGIQVVKEFAPLPPMPVDKHRVLQVLINLVKNAQQAVAAAPVKQITLKVRPRTTDRADMVCFEVCDTGAGIAPENLTRIFQHGFTTKPDGHGFGLHSAAVAAQAMGGSLTAASEGPGCGACFALELPSAVPVHADEGSGERRCTEC